jgi:predicted lipid-binding transport protein (Tim44 family)
MSYCPKCGNQVEDAMTFCPRCGASLKGTPPPAQPAPAQPYRRNEKGEKNEKNEKHESREKQEKGERGFVGYLIGGLILITFGLFSVLQLSGYFAANSGQSWALMLLIIGVIIIVGAVYVAMTARRHSPIPT